MKNNTKKIARSALFGALYYVITLAIYPFSFGPVQFRASEALCILPLFFPESVWGITAGCLLSNIFSSANPILDVPLGTSATFLACLTTHLLAKNSKKDITRILFAILPCILYNAFIVPFAFYAISELKEFYFLGVLQVGLGQAGVCCFLGVPLYFILKKRLKILENWQSRN